MPGAIRVPLVMLDGAISPPLPNCDTVPGSMQGPKVGQLDGQGRPVAITPADVAAGGYTVLVELPDDELNQAGTAIDGTRLRSKYLQTRLRAELRAYLVGR